MSDPGARRRITDAISANSPDLLAYFERRVGSDEAADALAETMVAAWRRSAELPEVQVEARMWLFATARNVLLNVQRAERRRWRLANRLRLMIGAGEAAPADDGAEVRDAVDRLEPDLAELVRLVHWDGFGVAEAGEILGLPASTARGRYQRAKRELRAALQLEEPPPAAAERDYASA